MHKKNNTASFLNITYEKALVLMRKTYFKSSYGEFYGRKPDLNDTSDIDILKSKPFSEID